jgi:hypothetical protein
MDEPENMERWRGRVDAFISASAADRVGLHGSIDRMVERADRRHEELIEALRETNHAMRDSLQALTNAIAVERARIDRWEARAEGASWLARFVPHGVTAAVTSAVWWLISGGKTPPPTP